MPGTQNAQTFRWTDLPRDAPMAKLTRARIVGEHAMISDIRLDAGCQVPTHTHANEQFACVMSGRIRFGLGEEGSPERSEVELTAGEVLHLPASVPHSAEAIEDTHVLDVFSPPSETTGIDRA